MAGAGRRITGGKRFIYHFVIIRAGRRRSRNRGDGLGSIGFRRMRAGKTRIATAL